MILRKSGTNMTCMKTQENRKHIAVIGAGASGLMCALSASNAGADVTIFEKNRSEKIFEKEKCFDNAYMGKKLLITGKGRCNVTNACDNETFLKNVPVNSKFLYAALNSLDTAAVMRFFEEGGCSLKVERGNRVFPVSDKSVDILNVFKNKIKEQGIRVINKEVTDIICENDTFCALCDKDGQKYTFDACVVCTGGVSYPVTGSTGDGYAFAESTGHNVKQPKASLVPLVSDSFLCRECRGLSLRNVNVTAFDVKKNKKLYSALGEMLFTHYGLSGPLVLSASAHMRDYQPGRYKIIIDLKPGLDEAALDKRVLGDFAKYSNREMKNALSDLLPAKLISPFIKYCGIDPRTPPNAITKEQRRVFVNSLKNLEIEINGTRPVQEAIITTGGVCVKDINPSTMESKKVSGLYFAGEVIDVDAYTGGFNLQIAFSTGFLAGKSAAE